jgi:hypothetical protein
MHIPQTPDTTATATRRGLAQILIDAVRTIRALRDANANLREALSEAIALIGERDAKLDVARRVNRSLREENRRYVRGQIASQERAA